eukprot:162988-Pelagomonas_calceolata.AAC.1
MHLLDTFLACAFVHCAQTCAHDVLMVGVEAMKIQKYFHDSDSPMTETTQNACSGASLHCNACHYT